MTSTTQGMATWLIVLAAAALLAASLITDTSGANLKLAPVFVGAALALAAVQLSRHRSGRRQL